MTRTAGAEMTQDAATIETGRVIGRLPVPGDAPEYVAYLRRNRERFAPAMPAQPAAFFTETPWRLRFSRASDDAAARRHVMFLVRGRESGRLIADITFSNILYGPLQSAFLGYKIDRDAEGQGLMREALEAALRFAFDELGLHRISANHRPENLRSGGLLRRLGFAIEGYARDYLHLDGAWRDHVLTALLADGRPSGGGERDRGSS